MRPQQNQNGSGTGNPSGNQQRMIPSSVNGGFDQQNQFPVSPFFQLQPPHIENMTVNFYQPGNYSVLMDMNPCPDQVAYAHEQSLRAAREAANQRFRLLHQGPSAGATSAAGTQTPGPARRWNSETQFIQTVRNQPTNGIILLNPTSPPPAYSAGTPPSSGGSMTVNVNTPRKLVSSDSDTSGNSDSNTGGS